MSDESKKLISEQTKKGMMNSQKFKDSVKNRKNKPGNRLGHICSDESKEKNRQSQLKRNALKKPDRANCKTRWRS